MRLNHVALTVSDCERSAQFYANHFGLTERIHEDDHLLIICPPGTGDLLALSEGEVPPELPRTNHFGFVAANQDEVRAAREAFREAGLEETEWQEDGPARVQVRDPDGYRVEVYAF